MNKLPEILKEIDHRDNIAHWLNKHGRTGAAAEIGVMHGGYAQLVLKDWKGKRYYMVDLWGRQDKEVYRERTDGIDYEAKYRDCAAIADRDLRVQILRGMSTEMAVNVPDGTLDWVWIDANHSYRAVLEDMDAWYPKVKSGGLFSGHDYGLDTNWPHWCEVKPAVDRWMAEHNIPFWLSKDYSWWAIKP